MEKEKHGNVKFPGVSPGEYPKGAIRTSTGRLFFPLSPKKGSAVIGDIAHALSNACRFTGHCARFLSVAEHSIRVSYLVPPGDALWALLHDASEAYLCDIAKPVKVQPEFAAYRKAEKRLQRFIYRSFGLRGKRPQSVGEADSSAFEWEWTAYMVGTGKIRSYSPKAAKKLFLKRFEELKGMGK